MNGTETLASPLPVLVTGGAGYIGSHAVLALRDAGHPVCVIDNLVTGHRWAVPYDVPFYQGDIADDGLLEEIVRAQGVRAIMHFAGSVVVPESVGDPLKYYLNNTVRTRALIASAVRHGVPHFIFSSTAATYGLPERSPVDETSPTVPINPYGWSKLMSEQMLRDVAAAHPINVGVLRYFNVAGADPAGRAGQQGADATHRFKVACEVAVGRRADLTIHGDDWPTFDGSGVRDFIHVHDIATAHLLALDRLAADDTGPFSVFNIGSGSGYSVRKVIDAVAAVAGRALPVSIGPRRPGDVAEMVADITLATEVLGWSPRLKLADIAAHALAWERRQEIRIDA